MKFSPISTQVDPATISQPPRGGNRRGYFARAGLGLVRRAAVLGVLIGALSATAACTPQAQAPATDSAASEGRQESQPYDLRGQWGVSAIDGQTLDMRIPLKGTVNGLVWEPTCAGWMLSYRTQGDKLVIANNVMGMREVCEIGYPEDLPRVIDALEGQWDVARSDDGNLSLTRGSEQIVLEKLPVEQVESLAGEWRVAGIDGEAFDEPYGIALSADGEEIWWEPRCAAQSVRYRIVNERFMVVTPPPAPPPPPGATPPPPPAVCTIGLPPRLTDVMSAIRAADRIERTPQNGVRLSGNGRSLTLFGQ